MKCERCGAQLVEGHVFCDKCGAEVRYVPDFNVLEEELLSPIVIQPTEKTEDNDSSTTDQHGRLKKNILRLAVVAIVVTVCVAGYSYMQSYGRKFNQGVRAEARGDYAQAVRYFDEALNKNHTVEASLKMGDDYLKMEDYSEAEACYIRALETAHEQSLDPTDIYAAMLNLYQITSDTDKIADMYAGIDKKTKKSLNKQFIKPPSFSKESGEYQNDIKLKLKTKKNRQIYYTLDNTMPQSHNGILYEGPIILESGQTTVTACCVDEDGTWGLPARNTYEINYIPPAMPSASPSSGTFHQPMSVALFSEDEGDIYYTWSGSIPTSNSARYTGPVFIPEGNNVLSAVVIDKHGLTSEVLRCNYVYLP